MENELFEQRTDLSFLNEAVNKIRESIGQVIIGQAESVDLLIAGILADGHLLIEGVPGVAKTLSAKLIARSIDAHFSRIQFTPDMMPSSTGAAVLRTTCLVRMNRRPAPITRSART